MARQQDQKNKIKALNSEIARLKQDIESHRQQIREQEQIIKKQATEIRELRYLVDDQQMHECNRAKRGRPYEVTQAEIKKIRQLRAMGATMHWIAKDMGRSSRTVYKVLRGEYDNRFSED